MCEPISSQRVGRTYHALQFCLLAGFLALSGNGCKPAARTGVEIDAAGTYALVSVDGNKVPCTVTHEGQTMTVQSGTFIINADGTCSSKVAFSLPTGAAASREVKASYTRQGATLTMKWEGAGMTTGNVERGSFTMDNEGMIFAYRK